MTPGQMQAEETQIPQPMPSHRVKEKGQLEKTGKMRQNTKTQDSRVKSDRLYEHVISLVVKDISQT